MRIGTWVIAGVYGVLLTLSCQTAYGVDVVDLWEGAPPHSKPSSIQETVVENWGVPCVKNITRPTITFYPAEGENTGRAIVVIPGGGYEVESFVEEGRKILDESGLAITSASTMAEGAQKIVELAKG